MKNKKDAKSAVMGIAKEYGFIEKHIMDRMEPDVRLAVEESMRAKDKKAAHAIKTSALCLEKYILQCRVVLTCLL